MKKENIKKTLAGIIAGTAVLAMSGCGSAAGETASAATATTEEQAVQTGTQSTEAESTVAESSDTEPAELGKITVGVCAGPYGDMFEDCIAPSLHELGYETEVIEISDIVTPNTALDEGELSINIFQHSIYLNNFNNEHGTHLTYVTEIPTAGMGTFSDKYASLEELPDGAVVAIPNDVTNTARALRVLAQTGIIELDPNVEPATVTVDDVTSNPKNLEFKEMNPEVLPNILDSVDAAVINGYFAIAAGLDLSTDLYNEKVTEGYINVIAIREADVDSELVQTIDKIVHSDAFRNAIEDESKQYKSFTKPDAYYEPSIYEN